MSDTITVVTVSLAGLAVYGLIPPVPQNSGNGQSKPAWMYVTAENPPTQDGGQQ